MELPKLTAIRWTPSWRIVASRFPPVGIFDAIADPADLPALFEVEGLTNPRLRQEAGDIDLVPAERRIAGPGTTPIMAAFTHLSPEGSRFSDGSWGVYYAAKERATAIAETVHHREVFLARTHEPPTQLEMRCYLADVRGRFHDVRRGWPEVHDADSHAASQALARTLRESDSNGLVYASVRRRGGQCVAVFRPDLVAPARQAAPLLYRWDGERISHVIVAGEIIELGPT